MSRVSLQDECHRRRQLADAQVCPRRSGKEFPRPGGWESRGKFLSRRKPDADVDGSAGRELGRPGHDGARLSGIDNESALLAQTRCRCAVSTGVWRRLRDGLACGPSAGGSGNLHRLGGSGGGHYPCRRWHQGNAGAHARFDPDHR